MRKQDQKSYRNFLSQVSSDLSEADSKQEQLEYLIELGQDLAIDTSLLTYQDLRVAGCASNTFVKLSQADTLLEFQCYSDSYVVKGYLAIFQRCLHKLEITSFPKAMKAIEKFAQESNFHVSHIPSRAEAFSTIFKVIQSQYQTL